VIDQRRQEARAAARKKDAAEARGPEAVDAAKAEAKAEGSRGAGRELDLDLGRLGQGAAAGSGESGVGREEAAGKATPARDFSAVLAERLKDSWNGEIVQSAHIVLKDGDSGTIRLRMRPESLGGVKIELNLADNSISGKIVVESDEAKSAFERNMAELQDAFKRGGFESAKLEVSVGSGGAGNGGTERRADGAEGPYWSERRRAAAFDGAVPAASGRSYGTGPRGAVDILA